MRKYVTYKRVSGGENQKSGLGLDAQERDIQLFLENYSETPYEVLAEFVEVQTGTDNERPQLHIYAALAAQEVQFISQRTKAALAEAKKRGVRLGAPVHHIEDLAAARKQKALQDAQKVAGVIVPLRESGKSIRSICEVLNASGVRTSRGTSFNERLVGRMLKRLEKEEC